MLRDRRGPVVAMIGLLLLLGALQLTLGLTVAGWAVGLGCGVALNGWVARGLVRFQHVLGPADLVTLTRAMLACAVAALVVEAFGDRRAVTPLVTLAAAALALDAVDGWVARWTRTSSPFGGRFDGEADAFLILVLSIQVAGALGGWVLAIGAARYAFALAGWPLPWLRQRLPFRYWRKVVTATQGIVLTVVAAGVLPTLPAYAAVAVALALLAESFGRDVLWLQHRRAGARAAARADARAAAARMRLRREATGPMP